MVHVDSPEQKVSRGWERPREKEEDGVLGKTEIGFPTCRTKGKKTTKEERKEKEEDSPVGRKESSVALGISPLSLRGGDTGKQRCRRKGDSISQEKKVDVEDLVGQRNK